MLLRNPKNCTFHTNWKFSTITLFSLSTASNLLVLALDTREQIFRVLVSLVAFSLTVLLLFAYLWLCAFCVFAVFCARNADNAKNVGNAQNEWNVQKFQDKTGLFMIVSHDWQISHVSRILSVSAVFLNAFRNIPTRCKITKNF